MQVVPVSSSERIWQSSNRTRVSLAPTRSSSSITQRCSSTSFQVPGAGVQEGDLGVGDDDPVQTRLVRDDGTEPGTADRRVPPQAPRRGQVRSLDLGQLRLDQVRPGQVGPGEHGADEPALGERGVPQVPVAQVDAVVAFGRVAVAVQQGGTVAVGLRRRSTGRDLRRAGGGLVRHPPDSRRTVAWVVVDEECREQT